MDTQDSNQEQSTEQPVVGQTQTTPDDILTNTKQPPADNEDDTEETRKYYQTIVPPEQSIEDLAIALDLLETEMGAPAFLQDIQTTGTYTEMIKRMFDNHTDQVILMSKILKAIADPSKLGSAYERRANPDDPNDKGMLLKNRTLVAQSLGGAEVSGRDARMLVLAANKNVKKIILYNSGFNITIRAPSLSELNNLFNMLNANMNSYGRLMGTVFYLYSDLKIKEHIWTFIESLVIASNLNKWEKGNRLRDAVTIHDYSLILLHVTALIHKNGFNFTHICTETDCRHEVSALIDLNLLQLTDFSKIPLALLETLAKADKVDPGDLKAYRKALFSTEPISIGNYRLYPRVPSMSDYIVNGNIFNETLSMSVADLTNAKDVDRYLQFNFNRIYESWILSVDILDEEGKVSFKTADRDAITAVLEHIYDSQEQRDEFVEKIIQFIQDTTITLIGYAAAPCDSCGKMPTAAINGYIPIDVQSSFFIMLVMRLIQED